MPEDKNDFSNTMRFEIPPELLRELQQQKPKSKASGIQQPSKPTPTVPMKPVRTEKPVAKSLFSQLLESIYDGCLITDLNGIILDANPRALGFLRQALQDVKGLSVPLLISGSDETLLPSIREALDSDRFVLFQAYCTRSDKSLFPAEISVNVLDGEERRLCFFVRDISERKRAEAEREKLIRELQQAISEVKTLSGLLPICAACKRVRDDGGYWNQIETYVRSHSGVQFSHGLCPECVVKLYPEYQDPPSPGYGEAIPPTQA
jgi:PAS domain S-box-containing protein